MKNIEALTTPSGRRSDDDYDGWESGGYHLDGRSPRDASGGGGATPSGILRLGDLAKVYSPAAARIAPMELKFLSQIEPTSPQPSIDRLSVTFAEESFSYNADPKTMDKVHFPDRSQEAEDSNEEDYSGSVMAIMQRRASVRRSKKRRSRRGSSPFSPDILPEVENGRRRSSVFTTSSGDTAITMEDSFSAGVTQEQIFENIKLHKEVLSSVKVQPWNMRRKLKLVQQAKAYIKKHEGALQERLAQSHSTKDMLARCNIYLVKKMQRLKREMANLSNWLIPWELRIKEIESHFGSVVASYFIFLRWLFWVNIAISSIWIAFVAVPEMLTADYRLERKSILPEDKYNATNFLTLWDFEGVFKYSPMFYGWYTNGTYNERHYAHGYRLPLAYFFTGLVVYIFSFVATLRKMAENSRMSKLSEKEDECIFSWKLFTGWDYMIGNAETATNRVASIIMGFKEALLEEAEKKREAQSWKVIGSRVLVNIGVLSLLALSAFAVITVVGRSEEKGATSTTWRRNEITVVMSLITLSFPIFFELLGYFEHYHPRKQLRLQLARIMVLNLLNLYSLIFALFGKISEMTTSNSNGTNETAMATKCESSVTSTLELSYPQYRDPTLEIQVGNLVREVLTNVTQTMAASLPTTDDGTFNTSNLYDYIMDTTTALALSYFENASDVSTITDLAVSGTSTLSDTTEEVSYEIDFTPLRDALQELFTTIFNIVDNGTTMMANDSWFDETMGTFPSLFESSISSTFDPITSDTSTRRQLADISIVPTSTPIALTTESATTATTCESITLDYQTRRRLRGLCWETMFGQELVKLTIMDLVMTLLSILAIDFFRGLFVRYMNNCWCWDLEKKFPQYGDFKVAENILHLVNNQGMVWMGMFFSPGLVVINVFKLYIMMYLRSWAVLTCNVPHEVIFRASRSNNFYYALLLMMLFLCVLPVSYAIVWLKPSGHCGPFSGYERIFHIFTQTLRSVLPEPTHDILDYIASPGIVIPLLMLLVLIIYYLISLSAALREANNDLKIQLRRERTEERRKMFQIVDRRRRGGSDGSETNNPFGKWKKLLQGMPSNKSFDDTPKQDSMDVPAEAAQAAAAPNKGALSKFITRAIKNRSQVDATAADAKTQSARDHQQQEQQDDATDTETHDSLPDDPVNTNRPIKTNKAHKSIPKAKHAKTPEKRSSNTTPATSKSRKDSNASNWSEVIPVITISKTESAECILEDKSDCNSGKLAKVAKASAPIKIDVEQSEEAGGNPKVRYVLKKQPVVDKDDAAARNARKKRGSISEGVESPAQPAEEKRANVVSGERRPAIKEGPAAAETRPSEKSDVGKEAKKVFQESSNSTQTTDTRTESSTDYKDSTFSN